MATGADQQAEARAGRRRDFVALVLLVLFATGLRGWQMWHTGVMSRDGIAHVRYAWLLDHHPWAKVIGSMPRHPAYPVAVNVTAKVMRCFDAGPDSLVLQRSAQATSALAGVLLVIPLYFLGRSWFGRRAAFCATALFQCLPGPGLVMADGLAEGVFLLFAVTALWMATSALRDGRWWAFALCGLFSGLAYLARPEGLLIAAAAGVILIGRQVVKSWRLPLGKALLCGVTLASATLLAAAPLMAVTGRLTCKPTGHRILSGDMNRKAPPGEFDEIILPRTDRLLARTAALAVAPRPDAVSNEAPAPLAVPADLSTIGLAVEGTRLVSWELLEGLCFFLWAPALLGLVVYRRRLFDVSGVWVLLMVSGAVLTLMVCVAGKMGYVSERHLLLPVLGWCLWAGAGLVAAADRVAALRQSSSALRQAVVPLLLLIVVVVPTYRSLQPLHADRVGFRDAGLWLAENSTADDVIVDPHVWAAYFAGRAFVPDPPRPRTAYVVLQSAEKRSSQEATLQQARLLASRGREVFRVPSGGRGRKAVDVVVYAVPLSETR